MSNNSKVLSLKYRPQVFEDLIGQNVLSKTISNSINLNKVPNAYLFTGIRGVGKTTTARIVAKALNCEKGFKNLCKENFCESCKSIMSSNHIDVLEMDAASKTGVEDVRELIEFSRYGPSSAKYKIFIIDEVHMLSKQAFNALLKTLEEPPEYLKFIFATTEIKKIPVTVISRCQRFDLNRVKSDELFEYIKKISKIENVNISDEALKLIVKISEGSVRDALSLLDRGMVSNLNGKELDLKIAQEIFGYFDKGYLIELLKYIFEGNEKEVMNVYKLIYMQGVEPKIFLNDFLEILYYFKNLSSLKNEGTGFSLNDKEFNLIKDLSKEISNETLLLFWQFTIKTLDEINLVSNQNISIEMFLMRLLYLKKIKNNNETQKEKIHASVVEKNESSYNIKKSPNENEKKFQSKNKTINQIKNISQEEKEFQNKTIENKNEIFQISNFEKLIEICEINKEIRLKYELENNVNLVSFENQKIEISFNENLDKDFVKFLSTKLYEWTGKRWIIAFSKKEGMLTKKQIKNKNKEVSFQKIKKNVAYIELMKLFPDAELTDIELKDKND